MKISLPWSAAIAELKFIKSSVRTEIAEVTEIVKITMIILISKKWLFEIMTVLSLANKALTAAMIQN